MRELEYIPLQTELAAATLGARVARVHDALHFLRALTLERFARAPSDADVARWLADERFEADADGFFHSLALQEQCRRGEGPSDAAALFWPPALAADPDARRRLHQLRGVGEHLRKIRERIPGVAWIYYQDVTNTALVYPWCDFRDILPPDFDWLAYHTFVTVTPENDPDRGVRWTDPNIDYGGEGLITGVSLPIDVDGVFVGLWSIDVPHRTLHGDLVQRSTAEQESFVVDRGGRLVAHPRIDTEIDRDKGSVFRQSLAILGGDFAGVDVAGLPEHGTHEWRDADGRRLFVAHRAVPETDWVLFSTLPVDRMVQAATSRFREAFGHVSGGDLSFRLADAPGSELTELASAYNEMADALQRHDAERREALEALQESERTVRELFGHTPVGLLLTDASGRIRLANPTLARILGREAAELERASWTDFTAPERVADDLAQAEAALRDGEYGPYETEVLRDDGTRVPVVAQGRLLRRGGEVMIWSAIEDVTERRLLEARLLQTQKMEAIGQLAGGIAHDFNNVLTVILGCTTALDRRVGDRERALVEQIHRAGERAATLTRQLLAFTRQEIIETRVLDVGAVASDLLPMLRRLLGERVRLELTAEPGCAVEMDRGQLEQVIVNLAVNARDAMPEGGRLGVAVRCPPAEEVVLEVTDEGTGMTPSLQARIFEPFFTTKARGTGTGLGLSTVHGIVQRAGGRIQVDSAPGRGTRIEIALPRTSEPVDEDSSGEQPAIGGSERLLLVEDDDDVRRTMTAAATSAGYDVVAAADVEEALSRSGPFDLVVTDVVMPGGSGRELVAALRRQGFTGPVLYASGYSDDDEVRREVERGEAHSLSKPFTPAQLLGRIRGILDRG